MSEAALTRGTKVGFVGLGMMGWPMAHNLAAAGFELVVRDTDPERQRSFSEEHGCAPADSPADFAEAGVVVTMLPDDRVVRSAVLEWEGGIASALAPASVVLDMSSSHPDATKGLAEELAGLGLMVVDAPVSGGVVRATDGTLTLMIGGDDEQAFAAVQPVLEVLGGHLFRTGPIGSGHAMKALNNLVGGGTYALVVEALTIGQRYGLTSSTMIGVMNVSTARSFNTEVVVKDHVLTGAYDTRFAAGLLAKDVGIAATLAEATGVDAPLTRVVSSRWAEAAEDLGAAADHSEAHKSWFSADLAAAEPVSRA
jgi:3-hydroxyisobutyrate dehydrogenase